MTLSPAALTHLQGEVRRVAICGVVYKTDGTTVRCTQHDEDITITTGSFAGTYYAVAAIDASDIKNNSDMSVDNLDINSVLSNDLSFAGFNVADIKAGLFRNAPFDMFMCQYDEPDSWQHSLKRGYLGQVTRTSEGSFTCEWRGLTQKLQQTIGRTYGERCDVERFCDARCGLNRDDFTVGITVTSVTSRKRFDVSIGVGSPFIGENISGAYDLGEIEFLDGENAGFLMQIKRDSAGGLLGQVELWEELPFDVEVGRVGIMVQGCDRRWETCVSKSNTVNFRGHGRWIPGIQKIIRAPDTNSSARTPTEGD